MAIAGDVFMCDGHGDADLLRFDGVKAGDEVHVDNRKFLAFCYFHRHHVMDDPQFDGLKLNGVPIYPQHPVPEMSPLMGVAYTGHYEGKLLWIHHTHDSSLWPSQGIVYEAAVQQVQGRPERRRTSGCSGRSTPSTSTPRCCRARRSARPRRG
jgi:hypothetical protein